jgi:hypothetical protein
LASFFEFGSERFERLIAWARYLHWADVHRRHFEAWLEAGHDIRDHRHGWEFIALLSAWYASLWVVVEGWREVQLRDLGVDELLDLAPRYQELLRRYRNGVFHYQPSLIDRRLTDFLSEGEGAVYWVQLLHEEFCRFYWELIARAPIPPALAAELRDAMVGIVGWIPDDISHARIESLRERARSAVKALEETGDFSSPAARDLLGAAQQGTEVAVQTEQRLQALKASLLGRIVEQERRKQA